MTTTPGDITPPAAPPRPAGHPHRPAGGWIGAIRALEQTVKDALPAGAHRWLSGIVLGTAAALVGLWEALVGPWAAATGPAFFFAPDRANLALIAIMLGFAVATYRRAPAVGLGLLWAMLAAHLILPAGLLRAELFAAVIAYGAARYGSARTVALSGLSIPTSIVAVLIVLGMMPVRGAYPRPVFDFSNGSLGRSLPSMALVGLLVLTVPWLLGLLLRTMSRAQATQTARQQAESDRAEAQEVARLRASQARLARDVHDVVGHSLAVIVAQAESARFLPDDDPERIKTTLATIASSARSSLQDVRQVLSATRTGATPAAVPDGGLDTLIDGIRQAGYPVTATVVGVPRPLPPELDLVAYRVLQEMLTNALRHGRPGEPLHVERRWLDEFEIEVTNRVGEPPGGRAGEGLDHMRRRLEAVGGRLATRTDETSGAFVATAWLPLRARETSG